MAGDFELHSRDGQIFWKGEPVSVRGINWFGLETADFALHGLWVSVNSRRALSAINRSHALHSHMHICGAVCIQCKNMGELLDFTAQHFNAVRMPFSAELALNMESRRPGNIDYGANPDLQGLTTGQVMDRCAAAAGCHCCNMPFGCNKPANSHVAEVRPFPKSRATASP